MFAATGLSDDDRNVTGNMFRYYSFNNRSYRHALHPRTPGLLVELGYLSNRGDGRLLARPDALAAALTRGAVDYLSEIGRF